MLLIAFTFAYFIFHVKSYWAARIINGTTAEDGEFPYAVSLRHYKQHICGGSIVQRNYVLTAAHCVCSVIDGKPLDVTGYSIQYGSVKISNDTTRSIHIEKIKCHNFSFGINDVALLKLQYDIPGAYYKPVQLAKGCEVSSGVAIGWGVTEEGLYSQYLNKLEVDIYDDDICSKHHPEANVCIGTNNVGSPCKADSGSPLLDKHGLQLGITSHKTHNARCVASKEYPVVYAKIPYYYKWIMEQISYKER